MQSLLSWGFHINARVIQDWIDNDKTIKKTLTDKI